MDLGLDGKVALVTASSRGLGRTSALALSQEGAKVVLCARPVGDPADFGKVVCFLCSGPAGFVSGAALGVDGATVAGLL